MIATKTILGIVPAMLVVLAHPGLAQGTMLGASKVAEIAKVLTNAGYNVDLSLAGANRVVYGTDAMDREIALDDCDANSRCGALRFRLAYKSEPPISFDDYNGFHLEWRIGKLHIENDNVLGLTYEMDLTHGVGADNIADMATWWDVIRDAFETHMEERDYDVTVLEPT